MAGPAVHARHEHRLPDHEKGYRYEPDKFEAAGLTALAADPLRWDPLIMKFCEFFGGGTQIHPSRLAEAWQIPQTAPASQ